MRYPLILLALLILLCSLLAGAALFGVHTEQSSEKHPRIAKMDIAADQATYDATRQLLGCAVGSTMILIFSTCLCIGAEETQRRRLLRLLIGLATIVYLAVFFVMMTSWRSSMARPTTELWGPFPAPTTWLVFGLWSVPMLFVLIYVVGFRHSFFQTGLRFSIAARTPSSASWVGSTSFK